MANGELPVERRNPYDDLPLRPTDNTIRLLQIHAANDRSAPLVAELYVASLDANPQYTALSYCWGAPVFTHQVICNDALLRITENLELALTSIRSMSALPLWVDQLCINQANPHERSAQVLRMNRIYSEAAETFVYLGEVDSDSTDTACEVIKTVHSPVLQLSVKRVLKPNRGILLGYKAVALAKYAKVAIQHPRVMKSSYEKDVNQAMTRIVLRPYFTRKWVIQEILMSRSLSCVLGRHRIEWDLFIYPVLMATGNLKATNNHGQVMWLLDLQKKYTSGRQFPLLTLLYFSRLFQATEPQDKVYSLLGIASDSHDFPRPDYGMTVEVLYHEISSCLVQQGNGFLMLHLAGIRATDNGLPSWVVDWRDLDNFYSYKNYSSFSSGGSDGYIKLGTEATTIHARGRIVDTVTATGPSFQAEMSKWDILTKYIDECLYVFEECYESGTEKLAIQKDLASLIFLDMKLDISNMWYRDAFEFTQHRHADFVRLDPTNLDCPSRDWYYMFARRFLSGIIKGLPRIPNRAGFDGMRRLCKKLKPSESPRILAQDAVMKGIYETSVDETFERLNFFSPGTRPIMTQQRRLGLAPALTRTDDIVCVIFGAKAPFILRPSGAGAYKVVGEAYVRDIMFGETLENNIYPIEDFSIC